MDEVIFPTSLALQALRKTAYKNTAHAVAELIDNSFDAEATEIGVAILVERAGASPRAIAVLDNGRGMGEETLRRSIQYGFSGRDSALEQPLGKYGVGLVAASFSQCSALTVMSWQDGEVAAGHALATGLRVTDGEVDNSLPTPTTEAVPPWTHKTFRGMSTPIGAMPSGSLIVWEGVEPSWKRPETLRGNLADLCGRIYRNFIADERLVISVNVFDLSADEVLQSSTIPAIDPTFLTNWDDADLTRYGFVDDNTLFDPYAGAPGDSGRNQAGRHEPERVTVYGPAGEEVGCYLLTASYRSRRALTGDLERYGDDPGDTPYGRLAKRLQGVSILRAEREIELDPSWLRLDRSVDRWVSVSLDFDPKLDDYFGVSNDKQRAHRLAETAALPLKEIRELVRDIEAEEGDGDHGMLVCLQVAFEVKTRLQQMQKLIRQQREGVRTETRERGGPRTADPSNASISELVAGGTMLTEGGDGLPQDGASPRDYPEQTAAVYEGSTSEGRPAAEVRPPVVIENDLQIDIVADHQDISSKMFRVTLAPAHMVLHLNGRHPLYGSLSRLLRTEADRDEGEPQPTLEDALRAVRGLLISYARANAEVSHYHPTQAAEFERCAVKWGEVAARMFADSEE